LYILSIHYTDFVNKIGRNVDLSYRTCLRNTASVTFGHEVLRSIE